ncbi:acetolactate synthase large subunit [Heyndrickxia oleronia]|uniref:acetolactate synthase large subunit n=1 Tax=Heyndrickxia oleronia TaxID=38875 RepID=UPI001C0E9F07|nr:acetolactate synthase large subunit [Heyndrickxia oleronia]MBU5211519.1 acetolactate synthase large subunit [Heyndrickxia oleronia]
MKASDVLVQCLENEGVEYVFGIPGKETLDIVDSLARSTKIKFINVRHEQGAAFMADVYGRLSGKAGVCLATLGPGATNLLTGISSANLDHSPVVALTGQAPFERQHSESHQYVDIVKIFEPITKWSTQIKESQSIPTTIRKAFNIANMTKPGSVVIELPEHLAAQEIPNKPLPVKMFPSTIPINEIFQDAFAVIRKYKKPFILIGNGVVREQAANELLTFIDALQSPAAHSFMAKGVLAKKHPQNFFTFGYSEQDLVLQGIEEADLLIVIGFDFVEALPKEWNKKKLPVLHIDSMPAEINEYYPVEVELIGNIKHILQQFNQFNIEKKAWEPYGNLREKIKQSYYIGQKISQVTPLLTIENMLAVIEAQCKENTIVISDVGSHKISIARTYQPKQPNRLILSNGLASMGIAIPGSIGAKLACPNDPVICITGDGGALMNMSEIETAKRLGLSFIIIILNDSILKLEQVMMNKKFGESFGVSFSNPDFAQLAESFGVKGKKITTFKDFEESLKKVIESPEELCLFDVCLNN